MKKLLILACMLWSVGANAQFTPGQVLTAAELNSQFALYAPLAGATFTGPVSIPNLTVTTTASLPAGSVSLSSLGSQAANTVVANATASSASPTAFPVPSCSTSASALNWTSGSGFTCNTAINAATLGGATFASPGAIGSSTASTGSFTSLVASGTVSGAGFVNLLSPYALLASPTFTGTVTTAALTSTGNFTPSQTNGIVGTTTNNNSNAGSVGEFITSTGTGVSIPSSGTPVNLTSISLTAGDWDVWGNIMYIPAGSTVPANPQAAINTTSATLPAVPYYSQLNGVTFAAGNLVTSMAPMQRLSLAATTTVYLIAEIGFTVSTMTATGFIAARRRR